MGNNAAAPKRLLPNRPSDSAVPQGIARTLPGAASAQPVTDAPASRPVLRPSLPTAASSSLAAGLAERPAALRPAVQVPPAHTAPAPETVRAATTLAAPIRGELTKPLRELIPRRGPKDFGKVFEDLVSLGVSDVHMTMSGTTNKFTVDARVDGKKQLVHVYEGSEAHSIRTLIKTEAEMTTGENLVPEDGSYPLPIDGYPYRARAVTLPLFDGGERIVFRLPQIGPLAPLEKIGFTAANLEAVTELLAIPGGMTVFAGPTGEGKSTTALSAVEYLRALDDGVVITLEDPVERVIDGLIQIEVNESVEGAGFGDMMRYLVRSDSNVLFIGEIRDVKTATAAVEIAKSGRRVLATIHATDNISAFMRLISLADETPLSVLDSVNGIVSQRLVPRLVAGTERFSGRYPIHEVTANSDGLTDALVANASRASIRAAAAPTSTTFRENVDELVELGVTTREEARKVVRNV